MSLFHRIFGGSKSKDKSNVSPQEAIQKLLDMEDLLRKRADLLETKIEQEKKIAVQNANSNKRLALQALKRKKRLEQQLNQVDGTLNTLESQRDCLENASTNTEVLKTLGIATKALKAATNELDVDKVQDLKDEMAEQQELANEITNVISSPIGLDAQIDEDELMQELEELEQQEMDEKMIDLPAVPTDTLPTETDASKKVATSSVSKAKVGASDQDDLKELMSWAS